MGEATPFRDLSCSTLVDEVVEEGARSYDLAAAVEAEVPEYKAVLNPSLEYLMDISALVCIPGSLLLERVWCGKDSVVQQRHLWC